MSRTTIASLAVVTILGGCAATRHAAASPPSSAVRRQNLVPAGASPGQAQSQEIYLLTLTETHPVRAGLWASGRGYARSEERIYLSWESRRPPRLEVEVPTGGCADLLRNGIADGKAIRILGEGHFDSVESSRDRYVRRFKLRNVTSCERVTAAVRPLASLEIHLLTLIDTHPVGAGLWAAGRGYAQMGETSFSWESRRPPRLEVEVPAGECADLLKNGIPDGKAIRILGEGDRQSVKPSVGLGKFKLSDVASCASVTADSPLPSLEIYLLTLTEKHPVRAGLWAAGEGYAQMEGDRFYSWGSSTPPRVEVEVPEGGCADLLKSSIPDGKAIRILGEGDYEAIQPAPGVYVVKFKLSDIASCESETRKETP
jgi:hypothetical protein